MASPVRRCGSQPQDHPRPMFLNLDQGEITLKLKSLLAQREFFYNQAKIKLSGDDFSAQLLMYEIIHQLKN